MKKALVLCGGHPQIALMTYLKEQNVFVILLDMNEKVAGRAYADKFYPVSVLDVDGVRKVAIEEKVDFILTVCADQVLEVVAQVSEELGLPWYIDYKTATNVSKKSYMKKIFVENDIPTSKFVITNQYDESKLIGLEFPLIVKPVDAYSSRGVKRVDSLEELQVALANAIEISRSKNAIVEEFVDGDELTVDVYIEEGKANVLCVSRLDKIGEEGKFVIHRSTYPAGLSDFEKQEIQKAAQNIATAFGLKNSPMLIQLITTGSRISVVEFCSRTGGGIKFRLIKNVSGFDVVQAVADLAMGIIPHYNNVGLKDRYITNEFLYCKPGTFEKMQGLEELVKEGVITEYFLLKQKGHVFSEIRSSGDRVACYTIETDTLEEMQEKRKIANERIKALSDTNEDLLRHDLIIKKL